MSIDLQLVQHLERALLGAALELERDDGSAAGHLPLGQVVLRMRLEERVAHPTHGGMALEELRDAHRRIIAVLHPNSQRLKAFQAAPTR